MTLAKRFGPTPRAVVGTVLLAAALVGCGAPAEPVDLAVVGSVTRPQPVGVEGAPPPPSGSQAPVPDCDPRRSLRPGSLPEPNAMPAESAMAEIQARGKLIAGVDQNTYLFGFRNPTNGNLEGFDIDRVHEIAEAIFGDENKVQYKVLTSAQREDALRNGDVDVVVRTFTANCARWQNISFSAIYYEAGQRVAVEKSSDVTGMDGLGGRRVCSAKGSTSLRNLAEHPAKPIPVAVDNWSDCLVMLQQRQVDAMTTDDNILAGMVAQDPNLKVVGPRLSEEPYGIGIRKERADLVRFVNAVLRKSIEDGSWQRSYDRWLADLGDPVGPPAQQYQNE